MGLRALTSLTLALALVGGACGPTDDGGSGNGGDGGSPWWQDDGGYQNNGSDGGPVDQPPPDNCSDEAKLVYVVDENGTFSSFDPHPVPPVFTDLGTLPTSGTATPFSMSVDRDAIAWVLYSGGHLYRVDIKNNVAVTQTSFAPGQDGFQLFGMGFVANQVGSTLDTLYVAGGAGPGSGTAQLATISFPDLTVHPIQSSLSGWPELTGNGNAELWGFFPDTSPPQIARIDKQSAAENPVYRLPSLPTGPSAWAFAFWGGDFWVFLATGLDDTVVYHVKGTDGTLVGSYPQSGRLIVGAGVSTCAPVIID
jgi:hypothetical protein